MSGILIYSCSSNLPLARALSQKLHVKLADVRLDRFANGEARVWVNEKKIPKEAVIVQSLSAPSDENLIQFTLLVDAVRRLGAVDITAVIPYLAYSKQDKVFRPGEPLSVKVIAEILQVVPLRKIITFDLHNQAILGFFEIPVTNLTARPLFIDYFKNHLTAHSLVVAPDEGAMKASSSIAHELGIGIAYMDKKRDLVTGHVSCSGISREIRGQDVLIVDDMIATGETLVEVSKFLKKKGAKTIKVGVTHHLYVPGAQERLEESPIDTIIVTDTIALPAQASLPRQAAGAPKKYPKLKVLSVAGLLAGELA